MPNTAAQVFLKALFLLFTGFGFLAESKAESVLGEPQLQQSLHQLAPLVWTDPWAAREQLNALAPQLATASSETRVDYYLRLAQALQYLHLKDEFAEAVDAGMAALTQESVLDTRLLLITFEAVRSRREGSFARAQSLLAKALVDAQEADLDFLAVFIQAELAFTHTLAGRYELAFMELQQAFESAVKQQDQFLIALVNESLGALYGYTDEYQQSIKHYQKALDSYTALGFRVYAAEATYGLAITQRYAKQWEQALVGFRQYRDMTESKSAAHANFLANYGLGMSYAEQGDCAQALVAIAKALDSVNAPLDMKGELYKRKAVCKAKLGEQEAALTAISSAKEIFAALPELKGSRWQLEVLQAESQVAAMQGKHHLAYDLLQDFHQQMIAREREDTAQRLISLRVQMEDARKDHEITLLKKQAKVDAFELQQQQQDNEIQRVTIASWVGSTCIAVVFLGWQLRNARRFRELSARDGLTGLYNRRFIFAQLEKLVAGITSDKGRLAIILIDLDNFKQINDRHGHPAGDLVLKGIAKIVSSELRPADEVARVGGEEFLCMLPRTSAAEASVIAQRLLACIHKQHFRLSDASLLQVTVSMGLASYSRDCSTVEALYAAADDALYQAKSHGKNQLVFAGSALSQSVGAPALQ
ncbi:GGDEF domain-containing protein [Parahaliea sp. F7430]|uniref:diguanylate cyclase n=1 Tax=Sediminihaliea albiluteola TaxID=2758564 RepID=A0A7W2TXD9_9GAMM|nr:tetratricopeptide repeat-containing diguanylate cyclase [Sediminihaliea albiluteola]MBA6413709.1 GGDEF domain-containing protein [Sediminihaliea albiluteola]